MIIEFVEQVGGGSEEIACLTVFHNFVVIEKG
jgi:hypothetical protein